MLYHLLLQIVNTQLTSVVSPGQPHLLQYDFYEGQGKDTETAVNDLSLAASKGSLHVIADEVDCDKYFARRLAWIEAFCDKLLTQVPCLHFWAASCFHGDAPADWHVEYLTRPLRSPPIIVREIQEDRSFLSGHVLPYSERGVADHTDGPPVRRLVHKVQGTSNTIPLYCVTCGRDLASFLHSLRVPVNSTTSTAIPTIKCSTTPPCLQWRDVLVLCKGNLTDQSGMVSGLRQSDIPVGVMKDDEIEDVATARSDVVWATTGYCVRGLERKVVVCLEDSSEINDVIRLLRITRCTSQLVIVSHLVTP